MYEDKKELWLAALRSGEYVQVAGSLYKVIDDGCKQMCCLGVLCDIYVKEKGMQWESDFPFRTLFGNSAHLPDQVITWAGMKPENNQGRFGAGRDQTLTYVNDTSLRSGGRPRDYSAIIPVIEEHWQNL